MWALWHIIREADVSKLIIVDVILNWIQNHVPLEAPFRLAALALGSHLVGPPRVAWILISLVHEIYRTQWVRTSRLWFRTFCTAHICVNQVLTPCWPTQIYLLIDFQWILFSPHLILGVKKRGSLDSLHAGRSFDTIPTVSSSMQNTRWAQTTKYINLLIEISNFGSYCHLGASFVKIRVNTTFQACRSQN